MFTSSSKIDPTVTNKFFLTSRISNLDFERGDLDLVVGLPPGDDCVASNFDISPVKDIAASPAADVKVTVYGRIGMVTGRGLAA